jgi:hypothetical protein
MGDVELDVAIGVGAVEERFAVLSLAEAYGVRCRRERVT